MPTITRTSITTKVTFTESPYEQDYFTPMWKGLADDPYSDFFVMTEPPERKPKPLPWERTATRYGINHGWSFRGDNTKYRNKK